MSCAIVRICVVICRVFVYTNTVEQLVAFTCIVDLEWCRVRFAAI